MSVSKINMGLLVGLSAALVLAGCGNGKPTAEYAGNGPTEALLKSDKDAATVDGETDPLAAHMAARKMVDPKELAGPHQYTTTPTPEDISKDTNVRVVRLENQVASLQSDFKKLLPNLSAQSAEVLETEEVLADAADHGPDDTMPDEAQPVAASSLQKLSVNASIKMAGNITSNVTGVRIGEYPEKTRIVFDMSTAGKFSYDLRNDSLELVVELPQSAWSAVLEKSMAGNPLVKGYKAGAGEKGGTKLVIQLQKPVKVVMASALPPGGDYGHRLVFDVAAL